MTKADSKTSWTYWPMLRDVKSMGLRYRNPQSFELLFEPHLTRATIAGAFHPSFDWRWWCSSCCVIWCHGPSLSSKRFGPSDTRRWWDPEMTILPSFTIPLGYRMTWHIHADEKTPACLPLFGWLFTNALANPVANHSHDFTGNLPLYAAAFSLQDRSCWVRTHQIH